MGPSGTQRNLLLQQRERERERGSCVRKHSMESFFQLVSSFVRAPSKLTANRAEHRSAQIATFLPLITSVHDLKVCTQRLLFTHMPHTPEISLDFAPATDLTAAARHCALSYEPKNTNRTWMHSSATLRHKS